MSSHGTAEIRYTIKLKTIANSKILKCIWHDISGGCLMDTATHSLYKNVKKLEFRLSWNLMFFYISRENFGNRFRKWKSSSGEKRK